jgi:hypothetical protein
MNSTSDCEDWIAPSGIRLKFCIINIDFLSEINIQYFCIFYTKKQYFLIENLFQFLELFKFYFYKELPEIN